MSVIAYWLDDQLLEIATEVIDIPADTLGWWPEHKAHKRYGDTRYYLDGQQITREEAEPLVAKAIARHMKHKPGRGKHPPQEAGDEKPS